MASQKLNEQEISNEAREVIKLINNGRNFLLSGGAGSGKTYSLVEILKMVLETKPLANIACVTYTNAAVKEIEERIVHPNLRVSTIHEFLWGNIKYFQNELQSVLIELINDDEQSKFKKPDEEVSNSYFDHLDEGIQYKEYVQIKNGIISHDELLILAHKMYEKHEKLCTITKDTYPYIFIDEYQDTSKTVVQILLEYLTKSNKNCVIGFFGDAMQSIYDGTIGNLDEYKGEEIHQVKEVKKEQNRRNPQVVIDLANQIRSDGLTQHPSDDITAPNMTSEGNVKSGHLIFIHSDNADMDKVKAYLGWDFTNSKQTKELNLTHNLIANKAGFEDLMRVYDSDKILEYVARIKQYIKKNPDAINTEDKTFGEVVQELQNGKTGNELKKVSPTDGMKTYIQKYKGIYQDALKYPYKVISSIYQ